MGATSKRGQCSTKVFRVNDAISFFDANCYQHHQEIKWHYQQGVPLHNRQEVGQEYGPENETYFDIKSFVLSFFQTKFEKIMKDLNLQIQLHKIFRSRTEIFLKSNNS